MTPKRIFVTGASGCIGHYVVETLIQETNHELYLLVRNPSRLNVNVQARPGVTVLQGDLQEIERYGELLRTIDCAILIATSWGGAHEAYEINVLKTLRLMRLLHPDRCQQVIYFSTASILDRQNRLLTAAGELGTDYIRSKHDCFQQLPTLELYPRITTLFPTLVFGGDADKPRSHLTAGVVDWPKWVNLMRFVHFDASFHFIHGKDIAQIVQHLVDNPPGATDSRQLVLGNARIAIDLAVEEACALLHKPTFFWIPLTPKLARVATTLLRIKMAAWDRFSLEYRHFTHQTLVNPTSFGLPPYCSTFGEVLKLSHFGAKR